jgi:hypothetical protein
VPSAAKRFIRKSNTSFSQLSLPAGPQQQLASALDATKNKATPHVGLAGYSNGIEVFSGPIPKEDTS